MRVPAHIQRSPARKALLGGRIIFNSKMSTFDCLIREISDAGAVLELGSTFALSPVFVLETKPFGKRYDCSVAWRTDKTVDVQFIPAAS